MKQQISVYQAYGKNAINRSSVLRKIAENAHTDFLAMQTKPSVEISQNALFRLIQVAQDTSAGLVYSDYFKETGGKSVPNPVIDYQQGSLRDDFDFGSILLFNTEILKKAVQQITENYDYAGFYDLRLKISQIADLFHLNEFLYTEKEFDARTSGERQFDYVNPRNREVQIEMEQVCTRHLQAIEAKHNGFLNPVMLNQTIEKEKKWAVEASVIIPVRNRAKTIADAVQSALNQQTNFDFNVIVVDNFSTDGTTEILNEIGKNHKNLVHIIPTRTDLGIGGCWNEAVFSPHCGKFCVQLDSDDLYETENTLQRIVSEFYNQQCAMLIGSYTMTDEDLQPIAPYLINHAEWTAENGMNNALRINGLGAPRAFYTPVLRQIGGLPNTSYGEDYAIGLRISREWKIGRIYESIYLCRRWSGNSDAALPPEKINANNLYKDKLRTIELLARKKY